MHVALAPLDLLKTSTSSCPKTRVSVRKFLISVRYIVKVEGEGKVVHVLN